MPRVRDGETWLLGQEKRERSVGRFVGAKQVSPREVLPIHLVRLYHGIAWQSRAWYAAWGLFNKTVIKAALPLLHNPFHFLHKMRRENGSGKHLLV